MKNNNENEIADVAVEAVDENTQPADVEMTEQEELRKDALLKVMQDRQEIAKKINSQRISDAIITIVQRAEMHSKMTGKDYFITTVENGIAFFTEEEYEKLTEKTLLDLRKYLASNGIVDEAQDEEVDSYAANLVIHYVDFKSFSDSEVQETRERFGMKPEQEVSPKSEG